MSSNIQHHIRS